MSGKGVRSKQGFSSSFQRAKKRKRLARLLAVYSTIPSASNSLDLVRPIDCRPNQNCSSDANAFPYNDIEYETPLLSTRASTMLHDFPSSSISTLNPKLQSIANNLRTDQGTDTNITFQQKLSQWAIEQNITHTALKKLLGILKENVSSNDLERLPLDSRTLLNTPLSTGVQKMGEGSYVYFGIRETIINLCAQYRLTLTLADSFCISVNIDGLPIFKSSSKSFWPILCRITSIDALKSEVFCVAIYEGESKAEPNQFLKNFVEEAEVLSINGITIRSIIHKFRISSLICDTPAKSYILKIKGHSGYFSCTKCTLEGDFGNNLHFTEITFEKRTDQSFRLKTQPEHHIGTSLLEQIPYFNMVDNIPIDYMHCILLGVMKRLLCHAKYGWIHGRPPFKIRASKVNDINLQFSKFNKYIPCEFSRKTRSIIECKRYKATEFRLLLLYTGIIVFKKNIPKKYYSNFLCFSVGTIILSSPEYSKDNAFLEYAHDLFVHFIKNSIQLYGQDFVSHNVHNLLHITDCVRLYGELDNFSAFPFENYMSQLKKKIRKAQCPLQQVVKRVIEQQGKVFKSVIEQKLQFCVEHNSGPLIIQCRSPQFKILKHPLFLINCSKVSDRLILLNDGTIVEAKNFATFNGSIVVIGSLHEKIAAFFKVPVTSQTLGISVVKPHSGIEDKMYSVDDIKTKLMILPFDGNILCFPLWHVQK